MMASFMVKAIREILETDPDIEGCWNCKEWSGRT